MMKLVILSLSYVQVIKKIKYNKYFLYKYIYNIYFLGGELFNRICDQGNFNEK